jgi:hypothetical protein
MPEPTVNKASQTGPLDQATYRRTRCGLFSLAQRSQAKGRPGPSP